jgi:hypothetical protein
VRQEESGFTLELLKSRLYPLVLTMKAEFLHGSPNATGNVICAEGYARASRMLLFFYTAHWARRTLSTSASYSRNRLPQLANKLHINFYCVVLLASFITTSIFHKLRKLYLFAVSGIAWRGGILVRCPIINFKVYF